MMLDNGWAFSESQAVQQNGTSAASANIVDFVGVTILLGEPLEILVTITETYVAGTSVQFDVIDDTAEAMGTTPLVIATGGVKTIATLVAGYQFVITLPKTIRRYVAMKYTTVGDPTAGKISACLVCNQQTNKHAAIHVQSAAIAAK